MNVIEVEHLHKAYRTGFRMRRFQAVKDLSLSVREGEIYGFIGPNGAGKTTTIKILMSLAYPTSGEIRIFGHPIQENRHQKDVGFLPERPYFYEYLTAAEFLDFYGRLFEMPSALRRERIDALLEQVSLTPHRNTQLRRFSKGMLQRVGVAQALINDPKLVVLDEPMSGLDPLGRMLIRDIIVDLKARGKTVFFSTHILSDVELICDRVGIIIGGVSKDEGTLDELMRHKTRRIELVIRPREGDREGMIEVLEPMVSTLRTQGGQIIVEVADASARRRVVELVVERKGDIESIVSRRDSLEELFIDELNAVKKAGMLR